MEALSPFLLAPLESVGAGDMVQMFIMWTLKARRAASTFRPSSDSLLMFEGCVT